MLLKISKIIKQTHNVKTFRFNLKEKFNFKPGQFIMLNFKKDKEIIRRAYSISSSPFEDRYIEITIKKLEKGFISDQMDKWKVGDEFEVSGPFGVFTYNEDMSKDIVMIGAGSGVTPFMCMLKYIFDKKLDTNVVLFFSARVPEDIIFKKELEKFTKQEKNFKFIPCITRPYKGMKWGGETGRICDEKLLKYVKNLEKKLWYLCGPPNMIDSMTEILINLGIKKDKIKTERFG